MWILKNVMKVKDHAPGCTDETLDSNRSRSQLKSSRLTDSTLLWVQEYESSLDPTDAKLIDEKFIPEPSIVSYDHLSTKSLGL